MTCKKCLAVSENEQRRDELEKAFKKVGCEIRSDSSLCEWFCDGVVAKKTNGRFETAYEVAHRMAEVRYLRDGYCSEFDNEFDAIQGQVEDMVEELAEQAAMASDNHGWEGYYSGIYAEACREVYGNGFYSSGDIMTDMVDSWSEFPDVWPWMEEKKKKKKKA
ncbi:hypothetical protein TrRE_jg2792 [Triparma retinervis]|uniref:Uncharacterized protein n=1 Tax=Triparma retinervis TaxID=2557542 RepID=A0A9W7AFL8_9STRA|nr:hypothetical protein TrRE_jg2792 [Triparma retinervis]